MCGQGILPNEFPAVKKNHQKLNGGNDQLRPLDELAVNTQEATAAYHPSADCTGPGGHMNLEHSRYATYVNVALAITRHWTLNNSHSPLCSRPRFSTSAACALQEEGGRQHFESVGSEGGTAKSRVIHAVKVMLRLNAS